MSVKPILFNTDMVRAILDGRKTVTRRCVKFFDGRNPKWTGYVKDGLMLYNGKNEPCCRKPPYKPGDILYVRETWCALPVTPDGHMRGHDVYYYRADGDIRPESWRGKWCPSIHMPKEAARIWLRVTDMRVERLQSIMDAPPGADNPIVKEGCKYGCDFIALWERTIKPTDCDRYGWDANPWVWVIEFERCEKSKYFGT